MRKKSFVPSGVAFCLAIIAWVFPDIAWYIKAMVTLLLFIASLVLHCFRLTSELNNLERQLESVKHELAEVGQRHDALSAQFKEEFAKTQRYKRAIFHISLSIHLACQNTESAKLEDLHRMVLRTIEELNSN